MSTYPITVREIFITAIYPNGNRNVSLEWDVDPSIQYAGPFNFSILRSGNPTGPFETIAANIGDVYTYEDTTSHLSGMLKEIFYQVIHDNFSCEPRNVRHLLPQQKYLIWKKILKDEDILLRKGSGREVYMLKRRHWGTRCTECYDTKTGKLLKKHCEICYGTTFSGGYFAPIRMWASLKPSSPGTDFTSETSTPEVDTCSMWMPPIPRLRKGDIIVETEINRRWEVTAEQPTELLRNPMHQDITLSRLPVGHITYKLAV